MDCRLPRPAEPVALRRRRPGSARRRRVPVADCVGQGDARVRLRPFEVPAPRRRGVPGGRCRPEVPSRHRFEGGASPARDVVPLPVPARPVRRGARRRVGSLMGGRDWRLEVGRRRRPATGGAAHQRRAQEGSPTLRRTRVRPVLRERRPSLEQATLERSPRARGEVVPSEGIGRTRARAIARRRLRACDPRGRRAGRESLRKQGLVAPLHASRSPLRRRGWGPPASASGGRRRRSRPSPPARRSATPPVLGRALARRFRRRGSRR